MAHDIVTADRHSSVPLVQVTDVTKRWGETLALDSVSLTVEANRSHALIGRNGAGKSSLVSLMTGLYGPDSGAISFSGEPAPALGDRDGWLSRVACVYQKPTMVPHLSVAENLLLNSMLTTRWGSIDWKSSYERAGSELEQWGIRIDPRLTADSLSVEQRQLVEIARALRRGSRFVILDEPTAQLDGPEITRLFDRITALQDAGVAFLFISHHLDEVYQLCSELTVLRDGRRIITAPVSELPMDRLVTAMVGDQTRQKPATPREPAPTASPIGDIVLDAAGLTVGSVVRDVSVTVRAGECVGLAGHSSSGKSVVGDAIVGLTTLDSGTVSLSGRDLAGQRVKARIARGLGYVPEDRHARGFVPDFDIEENSTLSILDRISKPIGVIDRSKRSATATGLSDELDVKAFSIRQKVSELSGGNQQKVVMARALASDPKLLVLIKPTVGVDIASKQTLYEQVALERDKGIAVLLITDELDELELCDRVIVMSHGSVVNEFGRQRTDEELVAAMEGSAHHD